MLSTILKLSIRNVLKNKLFTLINIMGLAIGLTSSLLIMMHVSHELGYDTNWENADDIYRISFNRYQNGSLSFRSARTLGGMPLVLREKITEVVGSTQLFKDIVTAYNENNQIDDIKMFTTDSTFFSVFKLDFIDKQGDNPLTGLHSSVISESAAMSLFGTTDAVGKWYKVCQGWRFCVTGVYRDLPSNTHLPFDMLLSVQTYYFYFQNWDDATGTEIIRNPDAHLYKEPVISWDWGYNGYYSYILLRPGSDPEKIESQINKIAQDYTQKIIQNDGKTEFHLQPVKSIHLNSNLEHEVMPNGDRGSVIALVFIALVIVCFAWINFINLTLIRAVEHAKSVGLNKIVGAMKGQLVAQFMIEALITNIISIVIALILLFLVKDLFAAVTDMPVVASISRIYLVIFLILIIAGILISGLSPALYLASYKPIDLFKGIRYSSAGNLDIRKILVVTQFTASIFLIIIVLTVFKQINYMKTRDLGLNIERTLVTYSPPTMNRRTTIVPKLNSYKSMLKSTSGIEGICTSSAIPGREILWQRQDIRRINDPPNTVKTYAYTYIDHDFIKTFDLILLAGRDYSESEIENGKAVIINETALRQLGFANAEAAVNSYILVGDMQVEIVGILKNFHQESLKREIKPILFFYGYTWMSDIGYYSIRINSADLTKTITRIEEIWRKVYPQDHFKYFFLDEEFNSQYRSVLVFGRVFTLFSLLAVFVAGIGLFGLALYSTNQRTKEIGIRKVNGARNSEILVMLNKDFVKWVAIAFVIAVPLAWYVMHNWLTTFAYRTSLSIWIFVLAGALALAIALFTVTWQSWKTATGNPVNALKYE
jgi:putative ABC transport system permease protein